jgi:5,10-methylenetetrahydromethanopterin reductase
MIDTSRLALGIHPNSVLSVAEMVECARVAETKGFAATWVAEGYRGDVFALLSALAMSTAKIRLGAGVLPVLVRSPWVVAMGAAAVDEISGGRFMLGLGAGHKSVIEDRHGLAYDRPTLRMREVAGIVRRALTGEPVNFEGEIFNFDHLGALVGKEHRRQRPRKDASQIKHFDSREWSRHHRSSV